MSDEVLVRHCSPTLAGMKTANLFSCPFASHSEMTACLRQWNRQLNGKGLRVLPMRFNCGRALIYTYRPARLSADLRQELSRRILAERGYSEGAEVRLVAHLRKRLCQEEDFPHEIGLFLGYPPEDVLGFIENNAEGYRCSGCWKVYTNEEGALRTFARYRRCTEVYCEQYAKGISIERLTVAG